MAANDWRSMICGVLQAGGDTGLRIARVGAAGLGNGRRHIARSVREGRESLHLVSDGLQTVSNGGFIRKYADAGSTRTARVDPPIARARWVFRLVIAQAGPERLAGDLVVAQSRAQRLAVDLVVAQRCGTDHRLRIFVATQARAGALGGRPRGPRERPRRRAGRDPSLWRLISSSRRREPSAWRLISSSRKREPRAWRLISCRSQA